MLNIDVGAIKKRLDAAKKSLTWKDVSEVDLALDDIPALIAEIELLRANLDAAIDMQKSAEKELSKCKEECAWLNVIKNDALRKIAELKVEKAVAIAERDAAVADIETLCKCDEVPKPCDFCKSIKCGSCDPCYGARGFEWRGPCEQGGKL